MTDQVQDSTDESILYEVLEYFARKQEPESTKLKNDIITLPTPGTIKNALRYLNNRYSLPESVSQQITYSMPWKFAIGDKGRILAILQENIIEIRKSKDEYSSIIGRASVPRDHFPQWRKLVWSPDGSILALASSNGYISFYNAFGNNIFNISPKSDTQNPDILEVGDAIASIIFKKTRVESKTWDYEFIRVNYSGLLKSYCISGTGFSENHDFSFGNFYRNGVNSVSYSEKHNLFFVAGNSVSHNLTCTASQIGLTCWRTLNDHPYYKLAVSSVDNEIYRSNFSIWNFIPVIKNRAQSIIFKTSVSPNNQLISCLHTDGTLSIWSLPSLKLQKQWKLSEQPNYDISNPLKTMKFKKPPSNISEFQPLDVGWWSNNAVIIARYSGSVSVCSTNSLKNLLGTSPEFLYNYPQIAELDEAKGFLCLDCEVIVTSTKRNRESNSEGHASELSSDSEKEDDESKPTTILNYTTNIMQSALYTITDIEKFQPKRKKSKLFHRTYRLLGLKSTTPEELYSRKIEIEEYEEALALANTYNLDTDLVYQTQWRKSGYSVDAIKEHLSKVSKRSWVLNECVSRVPETLEATRELLNFGLRGANLETLVAIGINDDGKFTPADTDDENLEENSAQLKRIQKINQTLEGFIGDNLKESQKELIKYRKKLLELLDKLQTYEILLESPSKFDKTFYEEFRHLSPLENAIKFAKNGNCQGVEIMFTYYGANLIPHWLTIVSFFPETLNPDKYKKLLPECDMDARLFLLYQQELRQKDWSERNSFSAITNSKNEDDDEFIYENRRALLAYRNKELTPDLLRQWYIDRAYEIEHDSRLVDNALALINIGKSHNITGLEKLLFELETLDDLVYKVGLEELSLTEVEKLSDLDKIKLLMIKSDEKNFVNNIKTMLLPYSRRKQRYIENPLNKNLLYDYLVYLSKDDLALPVKFFESLKLYDPEILDAIENITGLAMDCIYASIDIDMYPKAKAVVDAIATHSSGKEDSCLKYKELEKELKCLNILNRYRVKIPLSHVKKSREDSSEAKDLLTLMSQNLIDIYSAPNEKNWSQVLSDMLDIQEKVFTCVDIETCFEIIMKARLKSRSRSAIQGCINLIEMKKTGRSHLKVFYERAIDFILQASNEYFNNSKSLTDPDMELAKECLQLIADDDDRILEEYDLIESLQILNEFNINILPVQVRMSSERLKLIEDCLNSRRDAYKNKQKLLNLSKYLRIEKKNHKLREGKVLDLIAKKAFEMNDFKYCSETIKQLMEYNYQAAWNIALDLATCDNYDNLQFRRHCIWFAINNGPSDMIENLMKHANLLQIQISNADLEKCMPVENENLQEEQEENVDSNSFNLRNSDFTDAFSALQTEDKEFVPKIVKTSTDLMKSSAQIVKQSTFDLIKNARNTDFWKSKLNFNFIEGTQKAVADDEIIEKKTSEQLLKFPCFYETVHDYCDISDLDTKYSKYSANDYNVKLKLCQTLLRISLLSETASYGAEVSDVNHLLLECAEHTIAEDCTLGLAYLLSLEDGFLDSVIDLFGNLPQTELHSQLLAYFCSLKLYMKIFTDNEKVFLYDPIELIQRMASIVITDNDDEKAKLKQTIILLMERKDTVIIENSQNKMNDGVENFNSNNVQQETTGNKTLDYISTSEDMGDWGDWGEGESASIGVEVIADKDVEKNAMEFENNSEILKSETEIKPTLDYINDDSGDWDKWDDDESEDVPVKMYEDDENENKNTKLLENKLIDFESDKKEKLTLDYINSSEDMDSWNNWDDEGNITEAGVVSEEESKIEESVKEEVMKNTALDYMNSPEDVDGWDNWDIKWNESSNTEVNNDATSADSKSSLKEDTLSVEKRYEIFKEEFSKMENIDEYKKVKQMLLQLPSINNSSSHNDVNSNLALQMIVKITNLSTDNSNDIVLMEIKDFLSKELIPQNVLVEFLQEKKNIFTPEQLVYLKLSSKDASLQQEAMKVIKDHHKTLNLSSVILEEIFFSNLTSSLSVSHDLYYRILEEVFLNRTLPEIEDHIKLLIEHLVEQRNIPHAVALLNQLECIPPSLSTYENCFKLLLRK